LKAADLTKLYGDDIKEYLESKLDEWSYYSLKVRCRFIKADLDVDVSASGLGRAYKRMNIDYVKPPFFLACKYNEL
jgi:transposase